MLAKWWLQDWTFGGGCWKWKLWREQKNPTWQYRWAKPCGENRGIPPESLKPFIVLPSDSVRYFSASLTSKSSFSFVPAGARKTCHLCIYMLVDCCQPPPLYCNRKRFCSHQPLGFPNRWPRLLTMLLHWLFRRNFSGHMRDFRFFMVVPGKTKRRFYVDEYTSLE